MMTVDNQRYLLNLANLYQSDAIEAIKKTNLDNDDINDCINVIKNNDFKSYTYLDTIVRDHLITALEEEFCFIDADTLLILSQIVIRAMESNNKAMTNIYNQKAIDILNAENKNLQKLNNMLCNYAEKINPDID